MPARLRRLLAATALVAAAGIPLAVVPAPYAVPASADEDEDDRRDRTAPVLGTDSPDRIDGHYVVVLRDTTSRLTRRATHRTVQELGGDVLLEYGAALTGFSARLSDRALAALRTHPAVAYIEADQRVSIAGDRTDTPWGLDRVDQHPRPSDGAYHFDHTGTGVTAYVIDTGIKSTHVAFDGRVQPGYTAVRDGNGTEDCPRYATGHGTHVAGTIGGDEYGVAPGVDLVPVRVLDCQGFGTYSGIIKGVDWVSRHHTDNPGPAVANMSLTGPRHGSRALVDAINASITSGVTYVVAAGNYAARACGFAPAHIRRAITVGATNRNDRRAGFSNHGECVDLFAPGVDVLSAISHSRWATEEMSGTSMASPHVAGVAALYLETDPTASAATVHSTIVDNATRGVVQDRGRQSPNRLLYANFLATTPPAGNLLANPGFETGDAVWKATGGVIRFDSGREHAGAWTSCLGGGPARTHQLAQRVTLPAGATTFDLEFWMDVRSSEDPSAPQASDTLLVEAVVGGVAAELATFDDHHAGLGYQLHTFGLNADAERQVTIRFTAEEDPTRRTSYCIDDTTVH